jgi:YidC/Oxa1 family membrane protein insertase
MEKRVIIAVILCVGVLMAWSKLFPPPAPTPAPIATPATSTSTPSAPVAQAPGSAVPAAPGASPAAAAGGGPVPNEPEREIEVLTPEVRFVFSTIGGTLRHAQLRDSRYRERQGDPTSGHDLVAALDAQTAAMRTTFPGATFPVPAPGATWQVTQPAADTVVFFAENAAVRIEKRFRADTTRYRLHLDVVVQNKTDKGQDHHLAIHLAGRQNPEKKGGGFFSGGAANLSSFLCAVNEKVEREPIEKLAKDALDKLGNVRWIGTDEKFFLLAAVPYPDRPARERRCLASSVDGQLGEGVLSFAERSVPAGGSTSYAFTVFAGPKVIADLNEVRPGGEDVKLDEAVDVSLAVLSRPILALLKFFHRFAHNWGLAIILLTIFIKLVTFFPTQKSLMSAKKMQKLAPKMNAIRKKYENDRQRQSTETMNLYKAHGVSPFGGCLPSLIQMPIWIALYSTLNYAVELYRAPFIGHIRDLTDKDPYYVTPLLMGGVMFLQMKMSPASPDNQQQAMMSIMMPVMFTAFSLVLPSGLALYMLTSYLIGILQQLYINHLDRKGTVAA